MNKQLLDGFVKNVFPERSVYEYMFETLDKEALTFDDIIGNYIDYEGKLYDLLDTIPPIYEGINFERGKDPKHAMGIGSIEGAKRAWEKLQNTQGVGSINLAHASKVFILALDKTRLYFRMWVSKFAGSRGRVKDAMKETMDDYIDYDEYFERSSELYFPIKRGMEQVFIDIFNGLYPGWPMNDWGVSESVNFERGQDPKEAMGIGAAEILKEKYTLKAVDDHFQINEGGAKIYKAMEKSATEIYILAASFPTLTDQGVINRIERLLENSHVMESDRHVEKYDTEIGIIVTEDLGMEDDDNGKTVQNIWYWGDLKAATNLQVWDYPSPVDLG